MFMSQLIGGFLVLCLAQLAVAGGPDLRSRAATVNYVTTDESKIVLILSGRCEVFLSDLSLPPEKGNARMVETDLENCVITIVRRDEKGSGYSSWKEHCDKAKSLIGKQALCDFQGTISVENAKVSAVRATASAFAPAEVAGGQAKP